MERKRKMEGKIKREAIALVLEEQADSLPQGALFLQRFLKLPLLKDLAEAHGGKLKEDVLRDVIGLTAFIKRDGERYVAFCPEIFEVNGRGKTKEEARKNLAEAIVALIWKERAASLPQWALFSQNFWESPSLEELAKAQGVKPMKDASDIIGTWPGEVDDGFEEWIDELRHPGRKG